MAKSQNSSVVLRRLSQAFSNHIDIILEDIAEQYHLNLAELQSKFQFHQKRVRRASAYNTFTKRMRSSILQNIRLNHPSLSYKVQFGMVSKRLSEVWQNLSNEERKQYVVPDTYENKQNDVLNQKPSLCKARTKKGKPCTRNAVKHGYCTQHICTTTRNSSSTQNHNRHNERISVSESKEPDIDIQMSEGSSQIASPIKRKEKRRRIVEDAECDNL